MQISVQLQCLQVVKIKMPPVWNTRKKKKKKQKGMACACYRQSLFGTELILLAGEGCLQLGRMLAQMRALPESGGLYSIQCKADYVPWKTCVHALHRRLYRAFAFMSFDIWKPLPHMTETCVWSLPGWMEHDRCARSYENIQVCLYLCRQTAKDDPPMSDNLGFDILGECGWYWIDYSIYMSYGKILFQKSEQLIFLFDDFCYIRNIF